MQTLRIHAASPESARGLAEALREFHAELIPMIDGGYEVRVPRTRGVARA